jgi:hypothetical protein
MQLIGRLGARLHRGSADESQGSNHFDLAIASLGLPADCPGLDRPRSRLGIERIRLAASSPRLPVEAVRTLNFDNRQTTRAEPASQSSSITPGSLDADLLKHAVGIRPRQERREPRWRRRNTAGAQAPTELIERHPDVLIGVRVDPDRDPNLTVLSIAAV